MLQTKYLRRRVQTALSSRLFVVAASAVLVAVASTLIWLMPLHDANEYMAASDAIEMAHRQQAAWNVELARTRSDPQSNFDALAEFAHQTIQLKARLLTAIRRLPDLPRPVREHALNLVDALEAKKNHTDSFKRHYSVLRTATRYLPLATSALAKDPNINSDLLRDLLAMLARLVADPASVETEEVAAALADLKRRSTGLADTTAKGIAIFVSHAAVYAEHQASMNEAYLQATSDKVTNLSAAHVSDLRNTTADWQDRVESYRYALVAVGLVLLSLWCATAVLMFRRVNPRHTIDAFDPLDPLDPLDGFDSFDGSVSDKSSAILLVSYRILADVVAKRLVERAQTVSKCVDSLTEVRSYARSEATRKANLMADIRNNATEIRKVAEHLGKFATAGDDASSNYSRFDIGGCIERAILATGAKAVATVKVELSDAPPLLASHADICVIVENIVANAVQAVQDARREGEISISTERIEDRISVTVADNGVGMTPATLERAEQPFYSANTKRAGMGFATNRHLIAKYHGSMAISSKPESGTTIRIVLQIVDPDFLKGQVSL